MQSEATEVWLLFRRERPIKMDDLGLPPFMETPIYIYTHLVCIYIYIIKKKHTHRLTINTLQVHVFADNLHTQNDISLCSVHRLWWQLDDIRYHEGDSHQVLLIEPAVS